MNTRTMSPTLAAGFDWSTLLNSPLLMLLCGGSGGGIFMAWLDRRSKDREAARGERREAHKDDATVEIEKLKAASALENKFLDQLTIFSAKHEETEKQLRTEITSIRTQHDASVRSLNHEIRNLRNQVNLAQGVYHELFGYTQTLVNELRHNRARLRRLMDAAGEKYTEEEFPPIDATPFDPKRLFASFGAKDNAQFMPSKSTTARIEIIGEE